MVYACTRAEPHVEHEGVNNQSRRQALDAHSVDRLIRKLRSVHRAPLFVYEAGPCGFWLYRRLAAQGLRCMVVSPSMTPRNAADRDAAPAIRTKDEGHWILLPMSSDTFVTYLPSRSHRLRNPSPKTKSGRSRSTNDVEKTQLELRSRRNPFTS